MQRGPLLTYRLVLHLLLPAAAPLLWLSARRAGKERPPLRHRLAWDLPNLPQGGIVIHGVSVGEVTVARTLLRLLRQRLPETPLLLTATTATGLRLASKVPEASATVPFPLDLPGPTRRFLFASQPKLLILVETELWPEMLAACSTTGIPVAVVNARISQGSFRWYRPLRRWLAPLLAPISLALAQSEEDKERLVAIGLPEDKVKVTGNIKFDVAPSKELAGELRYSLETLAGGRPTVVAGSTMPGEEEDVLAAYKYLQGRAFLVLAPRHPERAGEVMERCQKAGFSCARRSLIAKAAPHTDVVVLDTIGELAAIYQLAKVAFVGGSLVPTGGHNPIEPALFGVPVLTGPYVRNFAPVYREFFAKGAAFVVHNRHELGQKLLYLLDNPEETATAGAAAKHVLLANTGATERTIQALECLLP